MSTSALNLSSSLMPYMAPFSDLPRAITTLDTTELVPFPQFNGSRFREILDEEMGFVDHDHARKNGAER